MLKMSVRRKQTQSEDNDRVVALNDADDAIATRANGYARCEDFRTVFLDNFDSLYQLCLLLTTDLDKAKECLVAGFDECVRSRHVFKEWALPWAKRILIQHAVQILQPTRIGRGLSSQLSRLSDGTRGRSNIGHFPLVAVLSLPAFERFAFVLSVLEKYSVRDCAFLLGCLVEDVRNARTRALEQIVASTQVSSVVALRRVDPGSADLPAFNSVAQYS